MAWGDPAPGIVYSLASCGCAGRASADGGTVFSDVPAGPNTLTIDGKSLSRAIAKFTAPRDGKSGGVSVGFGIGGLFGGGSHDGGKGGPDGHGAHSSSGGGVGLGVSIPLGGHPDAKPLYVDVTLTGPGGRHKTIEQPVDPASPSDIRIDFDLPVTGTVTAKLEIGYDKHDVSDPLFAGSNWTSGSDAAPNPSPPPQAIVPPNGPVKRGFTFGPDLALVETMSGTMTVGQTITFTYQVFNVGTTPIGFANVTTRVPTNVSQTGMTIPVPGAWGCGGYVYGNFGCGYGFPAGNNNTVIPPGGAFPTWQITAPLVRAGSFYICSRVSIPGGVIDVNHANDQSCVGGTVQPMPKSDLSVIKTGPGSVVSGLGANFTITIHNAGPSPVGAQSGITVADTLTAGALTGPVIAHGQGWTCTVTGLTVSCAYAGPTVASGGDLPQIFVRAKAGTTGSFFNCAIVGMTAGDDTDAGNNKGCVDFEVRLAHAGPSNQ